jgi:hypothetical protein
MESNLVKAEVSGWIRDHSPRRRPWVDERDQEILRRLCAGDTPVESVTTSACLENGWPSRRWLTTGLYQVEADRALGCVYADDVNVDADVGRAQVLHIDSPPLRKGSRCSPGEGYLRVGHLGRCLCCGVSVIPYEGAPVAV